MPLVYDIPEAVELERVEPVYIAPLMNTWFDQFFPTEGKRETLLRWTQKDNFGGLQQVRGYGGKPGRVKMIGDKTYIQKPGVYGEFIQLEEEELTRRRDAATLTGGPVGIADLVAEAHEQLAVRRVNRIHKIEADLLVAGVFSVSTDDGTVVHTDSYTQQVYNAPVAWSDHVNSAPIADLRAIQLIPVGQSVDMGPAASFGINRIQFNHLMSNTNQADLGGRRLSGLTPANSLNAINQILIGEGLPTIAVVEDGYYTESGTWTRFMPTGAGVAVGKRQSGVSIGSYRYTLNVNSPDGAPKPYVRVIAPEEIPMTVQVHDGHNGGVTLKFPGAIVKANI